jgi:hypothetical protein
MIQRRVGAFVCGAILVWWSMVLAFLIWTMLRNDTTLQGHDEPWFWPLWMTACGIVIVVAMRGLKHFSRHKRGRNKIYNVHAIEGTLQPTPPPADPVDVGASLRWPVEREPVPEPLPPPLQAPVRSKDMSPRHHSGEIQGQEL